MAKRGRKPLNKVTVFVRFPKDIAARLHLLATNPMTGQLKRGVISAICEQSVREFFDRHKPQEVEQLIGLVPTDPDEEEGA